MHSPALSSHPLRVTFNPTFDSETINQAISYLSVKEQTLYREKIDLAPLCTGHRYLANKQMYVHTVVNRIDCLASSELSKRMDRTKGALSGLAYCLLVTRKIRQVGAIILNGPIVKENHEPIVNHTQNSGNLNRIANVLFYLLLIHNDSNVQLRPFAHPTADS